MKLKTNETIEDIVRDMRSMAKDDLMFWSIEIYRYAERLEQAKKRMDKVLESIATQAAAMSEMAGITGMGQCAMKIKQTAENALYAPRATLAEENE